MMELGSKKKRAAYGFEFYKGRDKMTETDMWHNCCRGGRPFP